MHPIPNRLKELAMVLLAGLVLVVPGASARDVGDQKIREFATALIGGLDSAKLSSVPTNGAFDEVSVKVAAYRPDDGDEPGLAEEVRAISLRLTAEMQARHVCVPRSGFRVHSVRWMSPAPPRHRSGRAYGAPHPASAILPIPSRRREQPRVSRSLRSVPFYRPQPWAKRC